MQAQIASTSRAKKRQRSENWVEEDKILLKEMVKENIGVIENKNTDTNTNMKKVAAWESLQKSFNSMCVGAQRTLPQLKAQWGLIKMNAKKQKTCESRESIKTGGGPLLSITPLKSEDISSWLSNEFTINTNEIKTEKPEVVTINVEPEESSDIQTYSRLAEDPPDGKWLLSTTDNSNNSAIYQHAAYSRCTVQMNEDIEDNETLSQLNDVQEASPRTPRKSSKPGNKKKKMHGMNASTSSSLAARKIAETEIACRNELHKVQMYNEKKKSELLELEEILLKKKIEYYSTKCNNF